MDENLHEQYNHAHHRLAGDEIGKPYDYITDAEKAEHLQTLDTVLRHLIPTIPSRSDFLSRIPLPFKDFAAELYDAEHWQAPIPMVPEARGETTARRRTGTKL